MQNRIKFLFFALITLLISSCQNSTEAPSSFKSEIKTTTTLQPTTRVSVTLQPATKIPKATSTFISVSEGSLAGLIISSPILGTPLEESGVQPPTMIMPNGLGIINSEGKLIKFSDAGLFESYSPSGIQIVYQHGFESEFTDTIDNLYVYNMTTGKTVEIVDSLKNEGGKTVIAWSQDEQQFIYYNDFLEVLFEAYGYFEPKQLLLAEISTGKTRLLIPDGYQFDVNLDQAKIAYTTGEILDHKTITYSGLTEEFGCFQPRIFDIASASSQPFDISQLAEKPACLGYPKWSPDGKKIAWIGYFDDITFRPIIFNLQDKVGKIYDALDQKPESSLLPAYWRFSQIYENPAPDWIDNTIFWTPSYEINIETGEVSIPRKIDIPYNPRRNKYITSLDGRLNVSLNEAMDAIVISDINENILATYLLDEIYNSPENETTADGVFTLGMTNIAGWSPFAPPPNIGDK